LIFLLLLIAHSSPDMTSTIGNESPFTEYVKYVASETGLPTFWSQSELESLRGTSLEKHSAAKITSLEKEYKDFCKASKDVPWADQWWGESGCLSLEDWKVVDSFYRSRAMDFNEYGLCLVPVMDFANHTDEDQAVAAYTIEGDNHEAHLWFESSVTPDRQRLVSPGDEITISYGSTKGAAEMVFSYGFIDQSLTDSGAMILGWTPPEDDQLRDAKMEALQLEAGFRIFTLFPGDETVRWAGACIWAMTVNEEDGLKIQSVEDETTGEPKLQMFFKEELVRNELHLEDLLQNDRAELVFQARAYGYVFLRLQEEIERRQALAEEKELLQELTLNSLRVDESPQSLKRLELAQRLWALENELLQRAYQQFLARLTSLMSEEDVQRYNNGIPLEPLTASEEWERYAIEKGEVNRLRDWPNLLTNDAELDQKKHPPQEQWGDTNEGIVTETSIGTDADAAEDDSGSGDLWSEIDSVSSLDSSEDDYPTASTIFQQYTLMEEPFEKE
jgi:hypothetical protein